LNRAAVAPAITLAFFVVGLIAGGAVIYIGVTTSAIPTSISNATTTKTLTLGVALQRTATGSVTAYSNNPTLTVNAPNPANQSALASQLTAARNNASALQTQLAKLQDQTAADQAQIQSLQNTISTDSAQITALQNSMTAANKTIATSQNMVTADNAQVASLGYCF